MAKSGKGSQIVVWLLVGGLVAGLGGFGVTSFGGSLREVGKVGDTPIDVDQYARALRGELDALSAQMGETVSFAQASAFGAEQRALAQVVTSATLDNEAGKIGLSVGDEAIADQIVDIPAFQGSNGSFDREAYRFALDRAGLTEAEFEDQLRSESARTFIQGAITGGVQPSQNYIDLLLTFIGQQRDVTYIALATDPAETDLPEATDAQIEAYYQDNIDQFTLPQRKAITYAELTPDMLLDQVELDEDLLRQAYDERAEMYQTPERRLVERLVYPDQAAAEAAMARITSGEATFDALVEERGLTLADIDLGDVTRDDLGAAADAVFAADEESVAGPLDSSFGPALFRVNAVLPEQIVSFEEAEEELRAEFASDRARRLIEQRAEDLHDMLAAGATLEELAGESDMTLGTIEYYEGVTSGIAGYQEFRAVAADATVDDFPEIAELSDGGIFALRIDETLEPSPQPLDDIRDQVAEAWTNSELQSALRAEAEVLKSALQADDADALAEAEVQTAQNVGRGQQLPSTPAALNNRLFEMESGTVEVVEGDGLVVVVRLDAVNAPDLDSPETQQMRGFLEQQAGAQAADALFQTYIEAVRSEAGTTLNQSALDAVKAQF